MQNDTITTGFTLTTLIIIVLLAMGVYAFGRDLGQWGDNDPVTREWFQALRQPDTIGMGSIGVSCCGEGDAYWADEQHVRDGKVYAVITDERPDDKLMRMHEDVGKEYEVPQKKVVGREQNLGNPTGHTIIFLGGRNWSSNGAWTRQVLCYVMNGGV
jgi:hypothetical protein